MLRVLLRARLSSTSLGMAVPVVPSPPVAPVTQVETRPLPSNPAPAQVPQPAVTPADPGSGISPLTQPGNLSGRLRELGIAELESQTLSYDGLRRVVTATGKVRLQFRQGLVFADRVRVNLDSKQLDAEGDLWLIRGKRVIRGQRLRYDLAFERGSISEPYGRLPSGDEFDLSKPVGSSPYEKLRSPDSLAGPARNVRKVGEQTLTSTFGLNLIGGSNPASNPGSGDVLPLQVSNFGLRGQVQNWRFRAERLDLLGDQWQLVNGRFTNDPFSPAGTLLSSRAAQSRQVDADSSELTLEGSRVGLSNGLSIPLPDVQRVSERQIRNNLFNVGIDGLDRNGFYIERTFDVIQNDAVTFSLTPQFLVQRTIGLLSGSNALGSGVSVSSYNPLDFFGLDTKLAFRISPTTTLSGLLSQASLDPTVFDTQTRSIVDLTQQIGDSQLLASYRYRERVFNGSLGIQTVQQSVGVQFLRNAQPLGDTGLLFGTQAGYQQFLAQSDQANLINQFSFGNNLVLVNRALLSGSLAYPIPLWRGEALPATADAGLKYASTPVVPQFSFTPGLQGQLGYYSSGETQNFWGFSGILGLTLGNFSRDSFDYTNLSVGYTKAFVSGLSPLLFDRIVDSEVATLNLEQQIYGPWVVGFGGSLNLITANPFNLTGSLNYRQRAYDVSLSYNFSQQLGVLSIRLNDFNWFGPGEPLEPQS